MPFYNRFITFNITSLCLVDTIARVGISLLLKLNSIPLDGSTTFSLSIIWGWTLESQSDTEHSCYEELVQISMKTMALHSFEYISSYGIAGS